MFVPVTPLYVCIQFEQWKLEETEAIKKEKQKAVKLTRTLELNAAQDQRYGYSTFIAFCYLPGVDYRHCITQTRIHTQTHTALDGRQQLHSSMQSV
jgi:hypothetical protein